jgi:hypothetical protein
MWTDLKPLGMDKSPYAPQQPGESFQEWLDINLAMLETICGGVSNGKDRKGQAEL